MIILYRKKTNTIKQQEDTPQNPLGRLLAVGFDGDGNEVYKYRIQIDLDREVLIKNSVNRVSIAYSASGSPPKKSSEPKTTFAKLSREGLAEGAKKAKRRKRRGDFATIDEITNRNSLVMMSADSDVGIEIERETDYFEDITTTLECELAEIVAEAVENFAEEVSTPPDIDRDLGGGRDIDLSYGFPDEDQVIEASEPISEAENTIVERAIEGGILSRKVEDYMITEGLKEAAEIAEQFGSGKAAIDFINEYRDWALENLSPGPFWDNGADEFMNNFEYGQVEILGGAADSYMNGFLSETKDSVVTDLINMQESVGVQVFGSERAGLGDQLQEDVLAYDMTNAEVASVQGLNQPEQLAQGAQDSEMLALVEVAGYQAAVAQAYMWFQ